MAVDPLELELLVLKNLPGVTSVGEQPARGDEHRAARLNDIKIKLKLPGGLQKPHDPSAAAKWIATNCSDANPTKLDAVRAMKEKLRGILGGDALAAAEARALETPQNSGTSLSGCSRAAAPTGLAQSRRAGCGRPRSLCTCALATFGRFSLAMS